MKFKALLQTGLVCLLAATLTAPAYAEETPQAISQDTPLPGDFQAAPAARPTKPNTAQPLAAPQRPVAIKQHTVARKHASKHRAKYKAHKKSDGKHATKTHKKSTSKHASKPHKAVHKTYKKPARHPLKKLKPKKRKTKH